jgi:hypothetical protein
MISAKKPTVTLLKKSGGRIRENQSIHLWIFHHIQAKSEREREEKEGREKRERESTLKNTKKEEKQREC